MAKVRPPFLTRTLFFGLFKTKIKPAKREKLKTTWLENRIEKARSLSKHRAARAAARYGAPAGVALLVLIALYPALFSKNRFEQAKNWILKNPKDIEAHLILAEEFLKNNQLEEAKKELEFVASLEKENPQVLGLASKFEELKKRWRGQDPNEIKKEIEKWEQFLAETPTYRDGWLYLALYHFKLGNQEEAEAALEKAKELDPLNPASQNLEKIIKK